MSRKDQNRLRADARAHADALASPYLHPDGPLGTVEVPDSYLRGVARPQCFTVENNCLAPLGIVDGDTVLIDAANTTPKHGEIVACTINGTMLLKAYLCESPAAVRLGFFRDGVAHSIPIGPADTLTIIGVVAVTLPTGRRAWPLGLGRTVTA